MRMMLWLVVMGTLVGLSVPLWAADSPVTACTGQFALCDSSNCTPVLKADGTPDRRAHV